MDESWSYWQGRATEFSRLHMARYDGVLREAMTGYLAARVPHPSPRVLDAGTGAGVYALWMAEMGWRDVVGVDFAPDMLREARTNAAARGVTAVRWVRADLHDLPLATDGVDVVLSHNVTWVLADVRRAYAEMLRVLRPGGVLINLDAPYGQEFLAADARAEVPRHVTQHTAQLRTRNRITARLPVSHVTRPQWDVETLRALGARRVEVDEDLDATLGLRTAADPSERGLAVPFGVVAHL